MSRTNRARLPIDSMEVDPEHYRVEVDNEYARVLRVHYRPGERSVMHSHPESVAVVLTNTHCRFSYPDGRTEEVTACPGDVIPHIAGNHLPENLAQTDMRVIVVELKPRLYTGRIATVTSDPVHVDAAHYRDEYENERVRVIRGMYGPGEKSKMHDHPPSLLTFLTNYDGRFTFPNGTTEEIHGRAGYVHWLPATTQSRVRFSAASSDALSGSTALVRARD